MSEKRRFLILANPISGGGRARVLAPALRDALVALGAEAELHFTTRRGEAGERARAAEPGRYHAIVSVSGDGTVNEILNGLRDLAQPLAMLPVGTANVLQKELALPRDPRRLAALLHDGRPAELAVGAANGRRFLLFAGIGLDAAMVARLEHVRTGLGGKLRWVDPVLSVAWRFPLRDLRVTADGREVATRATEVVVTRVRNYGGIMWLPPGIGWCDGKLHGLVFLGRSRLAFAWDSVLAMLGLLRTGRRLADHVATRFRIEADVPVPYQVDGDLGGTTPVDVELLAERARFFAP